MTQKTGVPLAVLTATQDNVERVNSALRDAGHAAHCVWVRNAEQLEETLAEEPELILQVLEDEVAEVTAVARLRDRYAPETPLVLIGNVVDEDAIAAAMRAGARDMVSFRQRERLQAVLERELRNHRMERALNSTLETATEYKRQLRAYMNQSADAIAYVQEGIVVDVNPAWMELFGAADAASLVGMPLMDSFTAASHGPLKGALVAVEKGKWTDDVLHARADTGNEAELDVELELKKTEHDGEPAIKVSIAPAAPEGGETGEMVQRALTADPSTGLLARRHFVDALEARLGAPVESGVRVLAWVKPDRFADVQSRVGIFRSEDVLAEFAALLREELGEDELAGRFEGTVFAVLLERGSERDAERWGERMLEKVKEHRFAADESAVSLSCTIGLCAATGMMRESGPLIASAAEAWAHGRDAGGATVLMNETAETDTRMRRNDAIWVRHLKSALMDNRFRLLQLPIASLDGEQHGMFDILIRMLDEQGNKVLPSEFLPAAERNNLMQVIDRWVIGASCQLAASSGAGKLFVRLSRHSIVDETLADWLREQFSSFGAKAGQFCFQLAEEDAIRYLHQFSVLAHTLRSLGASFALEHVGVEERSLKAVEKLQPDYVKIDGSLIQSLARDEALQRQVQTLVERSRAAGARTIAERVEDANTMAVLWQLGISYMQGYYVHEPEVVLQETA